MASGLPGDLAALVIVLGAAGGALLASGSRRRPSPACHCAMKRDAHHLSHHRHATPSVACVDAVPHASSAAWTRTEQRKIRLLAFVRASALGSPARRSIGRRGRLRDIRRRVVAADERARIQVVAACPRRQRVEIDPAQGSRRERPWRAHARIAIRSRFQRTSVSGCAGMQTSDASGGTRDGCSLRRDGAASHRRECADRPWVHGAWPHRNRPTRAPATDVARRWQRRSKSGQCSRRSGRSMNGGIIDAEGDTAVPMAASIKNASRSGCPCRHAPADLCRDRFRPPAADRGRQFRGGDGLRLDRRRR